VLPQFKAIEVIFVILFIFAVVGSIFGAGWYFRSVRAEKDMLAYQTSQQEAVDQDREEKQAKSDELDEIGMQKLQQLMVENNELKDKLDEEINKIPAADNCVISPNLVRAYNNKVQTNRR